MPPIFLYLPVSNSESGFECLRVELTANLIERIVETLQVLIQHGFSQASFNGVSGQWFKVNQCLDDRDLTVNVWRHGEDYAWGLEFQGCMNISEAASQYRWADPKAQWVSFMEQELFSMRGLRELADNHGAIIDDGDICGDPDFKVSPRYLRSVSYAQLTVGEYSQAETAQANINLFDQLMPVEGKREDLLSLQALLDDLEHMPTNGLDFADVRRMFWREYEEQYQPKDYRCKKLNLLSLSAEDSWSEAFTEIASSQSDSSDLNVLLITTSLEQLKCKSQVVHSILQNIDCVLSTYVVPDASEKILGDKVLFILY